MLTKRKPPSPAPIVQVPILEPKAALILGNEVPAHDKTTLYFLTLLRQENAQLYLEAILKQEYGRAEFLSGALMGIDTVIHHPVDDDYAGYLTAGQAKLTEVIAAETWGQANYWKGYVVGLRRAARVVRSAWYDPSYFGDWVSDWFEWPLDWVRR